MLIPLLFAKLRICEKFTLYIAVRQVSLDLKHFMVGNYPKIARCRVDATTQGAIMRVHVGSFGHRFDSALNFYFSTSAGLGT